MLFLLCFPLSLEKLILEVMRLRIRKSVDLKVLEEYHYFYQENLIFFTYRKDIKQGKGSVVIEIVVETRCLFINRNSHILKHQMKYVKDLEKANLLVP